MTNSRNTATRAEKNLTEEYNLREKMPPRIREARVAMTGREFARRCGIAEQSLSRYERVGGQLPGAELLAAFAGLADGTPAFPNVETRGGLRRGGARFAGVNL